MGNYFIVEGSSGIGKKLCQTLIEDGNRVYATYFKTEPDIESGSIEYHKLDITAEHLDLDFLPERLDGMANCPGSIHLAPFHRLKPNDFIKDYELQVLGAIRAIQQVLPKLKLAEQASVVLFSTVAVQTGFPFHSLVSASKGAIEGLTKALAAEFAPKIRVNAIAPSITDTPLPCHSTNL